MKSNLDGLADTTFRTITTDLLYAGSNDIQGSPFQEKMTAGDNPQLIPSDQINITEFYNNKSLSSYKDNEENIQCGENFMDMECFMILNPSQQLAIAVLSLTLGTFTVLENLLVLCVILHSRSLRCRPSYHFIGSLAVADLLGSVIFVYSFVDFHVFHRKDSPNVFLFKLGGVTASFTASVGSLFLTAIDRYISIHRPLAYKRIVTRPKAVVAFCVMWTIAIVIAVLPLLGWNCKKLQSVCSDIFPLIDETYLMFWIGVTSVLLLFIVYAYVYILWKAHSHAVRMIQRGTQKSIIIHTSEDGKVQVTRPDQTRMDIRLAKTLVLILVVLIICWGPLLAIMVYDVFGKMNKLIKTVFAFCSMLCLLNSTVNPIIYALRSKDLRHAFRSMFPTCEGTAQPLDNSMGESDCPHKHANSAGNVHRAAESCIKSTVKIAKVTMSVSTDTSAEAL
ncbi:cannabinoid receptor 1-like [Gracilinanus agilis]|uniref:cannabinoid receptor 1-like n=1 Tax=Gracilinanus agilis TaxID=191870 RepID=UPI001CFCB9F9|nr:cannabinoid receptor 1 isoform X2 [Gracilinanus agilis]XP_044540268.1 cannabinoid receptor 1-like [Gracilinanus agilis]